MLPFRGRAAAPETVGDRLKVPLIRSIRLGIPQGLYREFIAVRTCLICRISRDEQSIERSIKLMRRSTRIKAFESVCEDRGRRRQLSDLLTIVFKRIVSIASRKCRGICRDKYRRIRRNVRGLDEHEIEIRRSSPPWSILADDYVLSRGKAIRITKTLANIECKETRHDFGL